MKKRTLLLAVLGAVAGFALLTGCGDKKSDSKKPDGPKVEFNDDRSALVKYDSANTAKEYSIPSGVKTIEDQAFKGCKNLTKVTIPDGVTKIGYFAFSGCENLAEVAIPGSVNTICANAFENCTKLTKVTISEGVKMIGADAFSGCKNLTEVTIPKSVTLIGRGAFKGCPCEEQIKRDHADILFK